ncbi:MAG: hypothetical protein ACRD4Y_17630, partial [Candidatus Acidiferrales bacterium]
SSSVLVVCTAISNNRRRYLQQLSTLSIFLVVAVGVFIFGRMYPFAIRCEARWLAGHQDYEALVLAQPSPPNDELKHIEWDGSGFAGVANDAVYLAFDPADTLSKVAKSHRRANSTVSRARSEGYIVWRAIGMLFSFTLTKLGTSANRPNGTA